jgi:hypothetical protein
MDSSSSLQGATGTAKTDPSNAYQQQNTKGTFHKRSGLQSTNTQQGNYEETLLKQTVGDPDSRFVDFWWYSFFVLLWRFFVSCILYKWAIRIPYCLFQESFFIIALLCVCTL